MRWEDYTPESVNTKGNGGFANLSQGVIRVGSFVPYGLNGGINSYLGGFAPRLGIAYQVRPKTVVRIGYGRSFDIGVFGSNFGHAVTQNLPVLVHQTLNPNDTNPLAINGNVPVYNISGLNGLPDQPTTAPFPVVPSSGLLQLKVEKRVSQGLQFVSHYTWSRARFHDSNYYAIDPSVAYGPDDQNRNHVWVTNILYELPFGKGKKYMSSANTLTDHVISGWR